MARRCYSVLIVFLLKLVLGECEESSEEFSPKEVVGDDYEQILQGIPTLFEYLLEILEERPEILEKDDVTFFQEPPQGACEGNNKRKRDAYDQCNLASAEDIEQKNIGLNNLASEKHKNTDSDHFLGKTIKKIHKMQISDNRNSNKLKSKEENNKIKTKTNQMGKTDKAKDKKRNGNIRESFAGSIDWNKFYLSSEEVEEQALKVEQAIEDHNKKKER